MRQHEGGLATILPIGKNHSIVLVEKEVEELCYMIKVNHAFVEADATLTLGHDSQDISDLVEAELVAQAHIHVKQSFNNAGNNLLLLHGLVLLRLLAISALIFRLFLLLHFLRYTMRLLHLNRNVYLEAIGCLRLV